MSIHNYYTKNGRNENNKILNDKKIHGYIQKTYPCIKYQIIFQIIIQIVLQISTP